MIDVLFTHSYFLKFDPKEYKAMMPYPPLGTLYAAAYLRSKKYSCALFDSMLATSEHELRSHIEQHKPTIVVIYDDDFNYLTKMCLARMREAAFTMSRLAKEKGCTVVVHGSDPADHIEAYIKHGADFVIVGEGEITLGELMDELHKEGQKDFSSIKGLIYHDNEGIHRNPKRDVIQDLDRLFSPARDLVEMDRYRHAWKRHHGYFSMNIVTTRGCPYHCNWCAKPIYGQVYHSRSAKNVVEEILTLKETYHPDHLWFCDDIFGLRPGWIPEFADVVSQTNAYIPFKCLSRADLLLKDDTVRHLARSGCQTVWIGAESGSQKILDAMEKGTTIEQIYRSSSLLHQHGIRVGFFLQYGYPGETRDDIERTLAMVKDCQPDEIGISVSYPLPGTPFYDRVKNDLGEKHNWVDSQDLDLMFSGTFVPDFYRALHKITHKKFRLWQGQELLKKLTNQPTSFSKKSARTLLAMAYHAATIPRLEAELHRLETIPRVN